MKYFRGKLKSFRSKDGVLTPLDLNWFEAKRVFTVSGVPNGEERGNHAHYKTEQILVCIKGVIKVKIFDKEDFYSFALIEGEYTYIPAMTWDCQAFSSPEDILMVIANTTYDPEDYINDFEQYKKLCS